MAVQLVPYNNAMRLGQGFNSYTQQICIDDAVVIDPERAENILTNDGTTMRILADKNATPSAWNRQPEVVTDERAEEPLRQDKLGKAIAAVEEDAQEGTEDSAEEDQNKNTEKTALVHEAPSALVSQRSPGSDSGDLQHIRHDEIHEDTFHEASEVAQVQRRATLKLAGSSSEVADTKPTHSDTPTIPTAKGVEKSMPNKPSKDTVQKAQARLKADAQKKKNQAKASEDSRKQEEGERHAEEKKKLDAQRKYEQEIEEKNRKDETERRKEDRLEQSKIREEQRKWDEKRRQQIRTAIAEAANLKATSLEDLRKIAAQNKFADRFTGLVDDKTEFRFDPSGSRGPSQTVTYTSRFVERLSDVTDDMCVSGSLSIKAGKIGGSGKGSFVDSDKFKESDLNFYISVKVVNQTINFKDALVYNPVRSVDKDNFKSVFGDSFIAGFVEGGEFNALVSMKILNKAKKTDIQAEAKVALTVGSVDLQAQANVGIAKSNLETNTETTIQVSWSGGGHIKPMEQQWNIQSLIQAAARFPDLVADCPQRIYAILGKYDTLRSFVAKKPEGCTPLQYENAQIYTNALLDSFMSYKSLYKTLGEQIFAVKGKTLEIQAWPAGSVTVGGEHEGEGNGDKKVQDQKKAGQPVKDSSTGLYPYKEETTRFEASIKGLSDARIAIRRQMARIVNEVDLIEKNPKVATDEDHFEPFQSPLAFETRLPIIDTPERLRRRTNPLTGTAITPRPLSQQELDKEQQDADEAVNAPGLFNAGERFGTEESAALAIIRADRPGLGHKVRLTSAAGSETLGTQFNNLEVIKPGWVVTLFEVQIFQGYLCYIGVTYDNGLLIARGVKHNNGTTARVGPFSPGERVISASVETAVRSQKQANETEQPVCVTGLGLFTNRGRAFLATANTEGKGEGKFSKDGVLFEKIQVSNLEAPIDHGTVVGFFGRSDDDPAGVGAIWRLGLIWAVSSVPDPAGTAVQKPLGMSSISSVVRDLNAPQANVYKPENWKRDENFTSRNVITFSPAYSEPPTVISGVNILDGQANTAMHADLRHMNVTVDKATVVCRADGAGFFGMGLSWMALPRSDKHIETAVYEFCGDEPNQVSGDWVGKRIVVPFSKAFKKAPSVRSWVCDYESGPKYYSTWLSTMDMTKDGFTLTLQAHKDSGPANRTFAGRRVGWIAYDADECPHLKIGVITGKTREVNRIKFGKMFTKTPVVFMALLSLDSGSDHNLRLSGVVKNIQADGFDYDVGCWAGEGDHSMKRFSYSWIAAVQED